MSTTMRAKVRVTGVTKGQDCEQVRFSAVCRSDGYPADGLDEDNTFSKFTPPAEFALTITNPALLGKFEADQKYYVDFHPAGDPNEQVDTRARTRISCLQVKLENLEQQLAAMQASASVEIKADLDDIAGELSELALGCRAGHPIFLPDNLSPGDKLTVQLIKANADVGAP